MAMSIFDDKEHIPNEVDLTQALGTTKPLWDELRAYLFATYKGVQTEWKFYSKKAGWAFVQKKKKRTMLYFIPCDAFFKVIFVFGEKAVTAAEQSSISSEILEAIHAAKPYVEGRSFTVDIKDETDIPDIKILLELKDKN